MNRFEDFSITELQTLFLGIFRLRDSTWVGDGEVFAGLYEELAGELQARNPKRGGAWGLAEEAFSSVAA